MTDDQNKSFPKSKKRAGKTRTITKIMRLTPDEWNKIQEKMDENGGVNFTKYAVNSMLSRSLTKTPLTKELILELSRQGNNLNQIATRLNKGESLDKLGLSIISRSFEALRGIYELLNGKHQDEQKAKNDDSQISTQ